MKSVVRPDFLTPEEMERARRLWRELKGTGGFAAAVVHEIVTPNMRRISAALDEDNEATVVSTMLEYVFEAVTRAAPKPGYLWVLVEDACEMCGAWIALRPRFMRSGRCDRCAKALTH